MAGFYQIKFVNQENVECYVYLNVTGATGGRENLAGGTRPFILREFNTDLDYYKPIRPMLAEIEILAQDGVNIDDFLTDTTVEFYYGGTSSSNLLWTGKLIQDDFQETWIDSAHIFTLRATDNFDKEKVYPYKSGQIDFLAAISYSYSSTGLPFYGSTIINGLFYLGMDDFSTTATTPLVQAFFNQKTFENGQSTEDAYEVIKKINRAWLQTMFQYRGKWWFFRMEEPLNNPINFYGVKWTPLAPGGNTLITTRWDYNIGVEENIKPIQPQPLKTLNRKTQYDKIIKKYDFPENILSNQQFTDGAFISQSLPYIQYEIDDWELMDFTNAAGFAFPGTPIGVSNLYVFRREEYLKDGVIYDNYGYIFNFSSGKKLGAKSLSIYAQEAQRVRLSFDFKTSSTAYNVFAGYLFLDGYNGNQYFMNGQGRWVLYNPGTGAGVSKLTMYYNLQEDPQEWKTWEIARDIYNPDNNTEYDKWSDQVPTSGDLYFYCYNEYNNYNYFKNLELKLEFDYKGRQISGSYSQYTKSNDLKRFEEEIYFDDHDNGQYKGAIFWNGALTEGDKWYRYQFEPESIGFKQANAIGQYLLHRRYRMKLDGKFFGLNGTTNTIGLHHTFIFVDDLPTKQFMILNLNEIDFNAATWSATLIETYDTDIDDNDPGNYDTYSTGFTYK